MFERRTINTVKGLSYPTVTFSENSPERDEATGKLRVYAILKIHDGYGQRDTMMRADAVEQLRDACNDWLAQPDVIHIRSEQ